MPASEIAHRVGRTPKQAVRYGLVRMVEEGVVLSSAGVKPEVPGMTIKADVWTEVESYQILDETKKRHEYGAITCMACSIGQNNVS